MVSSEATRATVLLALKEDLGPELVDVTTRAVVPGDLRAEATVSAQAAGILAGLSPAREAFLAVDPRIAFSPLLADGDALLAGAVVAQVEGPMAGILTAERTALNFLQRLSGIATLTRRYVDAVAGTQAKILDTRKTTPGLRSLERAAVVAGGGCNHRFGLYDAILIKDNHIAAAGGVGAAVDRARGLGRPVEVEVETQAQLDEALEAGAEIVLLDNFSTDAIAAAVTRTGGRAVLEASGGMTIETARAAALAGVDRISVGALTHSAPALDLHLEVKR